MYRPIKCIQVELTDPPRIITELGDYASVRALVRFNGVPIGDLTVSVINRCVNTETIVKLARNRLQERIKQLALRVALRTVVDTGELPLDSIIDLPVPTGRIIEQRPNLTIAVCTRDRPEHLRECLDAVLATKAIQFEVLVIDNAPATESTRELIAQSYPTVRYVREERPGLDWARNRAIIESSTEIIAYTDDDVLVDPHWAKAIYRVFQMDPSIMCVTGLVAPFELETEAQSLFEKCGGFGRGYVRKWHRVNSDIPGQWWYHGSGRFGTGANMAYRKSVFDLIGPFDPALDVGTPTGGGGDLEMFFRVLHEGYTLVYEPAALVFHKHRRTYKQLQRQISDNGAIYSYFYKSIGDYPDQFLSFLYLSIWYTFVYHLGRLKSALMHKTRPHWRLIATEMFAGFGAAGRYRRSAKYARGITAKFGEMTDSPPLPKPNGIKFSSIRKRSVDVLNIDLASGFRLAENGAKFGSTRVFVKWIGMTLGQVDITNARRPLAIDEILDAISTKLCDRMFDALNTQVWTDRAAKSFLDIVASVYLQIDGSSIQFDSQLPATTKVSVIVATCDRPTDLKMCLDGLVSQRTCRPVEIIIVDNKPWSGLTPAVVAEYPGIKLVEEKRPGSSYARNAGIRSSTGDIIVTTDDDVVLPPDWLEQLVAPFARADVMAVTGNILPLELGTYSQWQFEAYGGLGRGFGSWEVDEYWFDSYRNRAAPTWELGATANSAYRAQLFADPEVGLMNEALGAGMPTGVGEDSYLFYKIVQAGYRIRYEASAYVWHKHRTELTALRNQIFSYSKGHIAHHLMTLLNDRDLRALFQIFIFMPLWRVKQFFRIFLAGFLTAGGSTSDLEQGGGLMATEILGNLLGPVGYLQAIAKVNNLGASEPYIPVRLRDSTSSALAVAVGPMFSIVIPCYNCAAFVYETLDSLLAQTYPQWEALLVDDGSRDDTVRVLNEYAAKDARFKAIRQANGGVSTARNNGIAHANGDWMLFLDSDDWIANNYLQRMSEMIAPDPQVELIHCGWTGIKPDGEATDPKWFLSEPVEAILDNSPEAFFKLTAIVCPFIIHSAVVKREKVLEVGCFDSDLRTSEDWDLWQRLARCGINKLYTKDVLVSYRMRPDSLTRSGVRMLRDGLAVLRRGHGIDLRLAGIPQAFPNGVDKNGLKKNIGYLALWSAGSIIGSGNDATIVLDELDDLREPVLDCIGSAFVLMESIILSACRVKSEAAAVYRAVEPHLTYFLECLEVHTKYNGFARATAVAAERYAIENSLIGLTSIMTSSTGGVGRTEGRVIELTAPFSDFVAESGETERLIISAEWRGERLGTVELPVTDGRIAAYLLLDAVAAAFPNQILVKYFLCKGFGDLTLSPSPSGYDLLANGETVVHGTTEAALSTTEAFQRFAFSLLSYELYRSYYVGLTLDLPETGEFFDILNLTSNEVPTVELTDDVLPTFVPVAGSALISFTIGGMPLGTLRMEANDAGLITPRDLVKMALYGSHKEIFTIVVRDVILGRSPFEAPYSLRQRLRREMDVIGLDLPAYIGLNGKTPVTDNQDESWHGIAGIASGDIVIGRRYLNLVGSAASRRSVLPSAVLTDSSMPKSLAVLESVVQRAAPGAHKVIHYTPEVIPVRSSVNLMGDDLPDWNYVKRASRFNLSANNVVPVFMYHSVAPKGPSKLTRFRLTPAQFEEQLSTLQTDGFHAVSLNQWQAYALAGDPIPGNAVILTFDDGFADFAEYAWPLLRKYSMSATVFLVTAHVGGTNAWETQGEYPIPLMDWDTIRALKRDGCDFGAHTHTHRRLTSLRTEEVAREGIVCKAIIESELGARVTTIAHPYGDVDNVVGHILGGCGYTVGVGTDTQLAHYYHNHLQLPRIEVAGFHSLGDFSWHLNNAKSYETRVDFQGRNK